MTSRQIHVLQLLVGEMQNFSYIVHDGKKAVIIDASFGGELILRKIKELELQAVAILSTHRHFDHNMDNTFLKSRLSIPVLAHRVSPIEKDKEFDDGDELQFGDIRLNVLYTPGHTPDSVCFLTNDCIFTGDTLFVGTCGRADLPESDPKQLFASLDRIKHLNPSLIIYSGHDYGSTATSTIGKEILENPALIATTEQEFLSYIL
jgi:glyoxylase-like metal-dependent hydrolase (beta-lactamase superfamily II)